MPNHMMMSGASATFGVAKTPIISGPDDLFAPGNERDRDGGPDAGRDADRIAANHFDKRALQMIDKRAVERDRHECAGRR